MIKPTTDTELRTMIEHEIRCGASIKQSYPQSGYYEITDSIIQQLENMGYRKTQFINNPYWDLYHNYTPILTLPIKKDGVTDD